MAKPVGIVTLNAADPLYDADGYKLAGIVPFTEQATDGPARMLSPGSPDTADNMTWGGDTEADAWGDDPPHLITEGAATNDSYYHLASSVLVESYPCAFGLHVRPNNATLAFLFHLRNSAAENDDYISFQMSNVPSANRLKVNIGKDGGAATYTHNPGSAWTVDQDYSVLINIADSSTIQILNNSLEGKTFSIDGLDGLGDVYTFTATPTSARDIDIGATIEDSVDNAVSCINDSGVEGTDYGTGTAQHPAVSAIKEGTDIIRFWRKAGVTASGSDDGKFKIDVAGTASFLLSGGDMDPTATPPVGDAYVQVYVDGGSEAGGAAALAVAFPVDVNELWVGRASEPGTGGYANCDMDLFAIFNNTLNSTERTAWHEQGWAGTVEEDRYGLLTASEADQDIAATFEADLTGVAGLETPIFAARRKVPVAYPQVGQIYRKALTGRGPSRGH